MSSSGLVVPSGDKPLLPVKKAIEELETIYHSASKASMCANSGAKIFVEWYNHVVDVISLVFGGDSLELTYLGDLDFGSPVNATDKDRVAFHIAMSSITSVIADWIRTLTNIEDKSSARQMALIKAKRVKGDSAQNGNVLDDVNDRTGNVFVVHGHDEALREKVARTLEKLGLKPIILREQPNEGKTLIEKFESKADVGFAVVLLTPDDIGYDKNKPNEAAGRARQNVVLELGYFVGRLGRNRVMTIKHPNLQLPGDVLGLVYSDATNESQWKFELVRELNAAGYKVDANRLLA